MIEKVEWKELGFSSRPTWEELRQKIARNVEPLPNVESLRFGMVGRGNRSDANAMFCCHGELAANSSPCLTAIPAVLPHLESVRHAFRDEYIGPGSSVSWHPDPKYSHTTPPDVATGSVGVLVRLPENGFGFLSSAHPFMSPDQLDQSTPSNWCIHPSHNDGGFDPGYDLTKDDYINTDDIVARLHRHHPIAFNRADPSKPDLAVCRLESHIAAKIRSPGRLTQTVAVFEIEWEQEQSFDLGQWELSHTQVCKWLQSDFAAEWLVRNVPGAKDGNVTCHRPYRSGLHNRGLSYRRFVVRVIQRSEYNLIVQVLNDVGQLKGFASPNDVSVGNTVYKLGRTTGLTVGTIRAATADAFGFRYRRREKDSAHFSDLLVVHSEGDEFAAPGDSGGLVFRPTIQGGTVVVGLVLGALDVAKAGHLTLVQPLTEAILSEFGAALWLPTHE